MATYVWADIYGEAEKNPNENCFTLCVTAEEHDKEIKLLRETVATPLDCKGDECAWFLIYERRMKEKEQEIERLAAERDALKAALIQLRDCDWVITLPDRMDAVREIAKDALDAAREG